MSKIVTYHRGVNAEILFNTKTLDAALEELIEQDRPDVAQKRAAWQAKIRDVDKLLSFLEQSLQYFTPNDCNRYFKYCG